MKKTFGFTIFILTVALVSAVFCAAAIPAFGAGADAGPDGAAAADNADGPEATAAAVNADAAMGADPSDAVDSGGALDVAAAAEELLAFFEKKAGVSSVQELLDSYSAEPESCLWNIVSIRNFCSELDYGSVRKSLEELVKNTEHMVLTDKLKYALTLQSLESGSPFIAETLEETDGALMSMVFGLHLANNGVRAGDITVRSLTSSILALQHEDGGWSVIGEKGDVDVTAMVLEALAAQAADTLPADEALKTAVERALDYLSFAQLSDGGFCTFGVENPESSFQVLLALSCLGIDGLSDDRFIKNGNTMLDAAESFRLDDGSFCHVLGGAYNKMATMQALYSFVSYEMFQSGKGPFYVFGPLSEKPAAQGKEPFIRNYKHIIYIAAAILVLFRIVALICRKKKKLMPYISAVLAGLLVCAGAYFTDIQKTEDYYKAGDVEGPAVETRISISCVSVAGRKDFIPADGAVLKNAVVKLPEGSTAFDQLVAAAKEYSVRIDTEGQGYVKGINSIYEFDFGDLSGWMLSVNGAFSSVGASDIILKEGDLVEWVYTIEMGKDVGNDYSGE